MALETRKIQRTGKCRGCRIALLPGTLIVTNNQSWDTVILCVDCMFKIAQFAINEAAPTELSEYLVMRKLTK